MIRNRLHELKQDDSDETVGVDEVNEYENDVHLMLNQSLPVKNELKSLRNSIDNVKLTFEQNFHYNSKDVKAEMLRLDTGILTSFANVSKSIQKLQEDWSKLCDTETKSRIIFNEFTYLNNEFYYIFEYYAKAYEIYEKNYLKVLNQEARILSKDSIDDEVEGLLINENRPSLFTDNILEDTQKTKQELQDVIERCNLLKDIEKSLENIRDLFLVITMSVKEQGIMIKEADTKTEDTVKNLDKSRNDLKKANQYYKESTKKKIILIALLIVVVVIVVLILCLN